MRESNNELNELFIKFEWLHRRYQMLMMRQFGPMGNPFRGQGRVLALLKIKPEITQKELANILDIRNQSLGELLTKLEKSGYITREPSENDRRSMLICLTELGLQEAEKLDQQPDENQLFSCLNEDEQENLKRYMQRLTETLEAEFSNSEPDFEHKMHREFHGREGCGFEGRGHEDHRPFGRRPPRG